MANTREIRRRIKSIKNTAQITKAMQMVAASKMRKAQELALIGQDYAELINSILASAEGRLDLEAHPLMTPRPVKNICAIVVSTDKGLCGALNTNLLRLAASYPSDTQFIAIGRKGSTFLARTKRNLVADFEVGDRLTFSDSRKIGKFAMDLYLSGKVDRVDILYTDFISTINQKPEAVVLLPVQPETTLQTSGVTNQLPKETKNIQVRPQYKFEPDMQTVLNHLIPHIVNYQIWHYLLESKASEHSARMVAMKNATDNANQIIKDLTLEYNKVRQAAITNEILEISSAAAAMSQ